MGIACLLASIVVFVTVLLLKGVANVALVSQAECVGKGGDSSRQGEESSGKKSKSQDEQREIEEDE